MLYEKNMIRMAITMSKVKEKERKGTVENLMISLPQVKIFPWITKLLKHAIKLPKAAWISPCTW